MIIETDFLDHPKICILRDKYGSRAVEWVIRMWSFCQTRKAWRFKESAAFLKAITRADVPDNELWDLFQNTRIIDTFDGGFEVHDWKEANKNLISSWRNGTKGGRKKRTRGLTGGLPVGSPPPTRGVTDRVDRLDGIDKIEMPAVLNCPEFSATWKRWIDYRMPFKDVKNPIEMLETQLRNLAAVGKEAAIATLESSMMNGYTGIFPQKFKQMSLASKPKGGRDFI